MDSDNCHHGTVFMADHPFMFAIRDEVDGTVLLFRHVANTLQVLLLQSIIVAYKINLEVNILDE